MSSEGEGLFPRPLSGGVVNPLPSGRVPARQAIVGRHVRLEPLDPVQHGDDLYDASHISDDGRAVWTYLPEGPWPDRGAYHAHLRANAGSLERIFYALRPLPGGLACGQASFMDTLKNIIHRVLNRAGNGTVYCGSRRLVL